MQRTAPVTANLRVQPEHLLVMETAPMAASGETGKSQKQKIQKTASSLATGAGNVLPSSVFTAHLFPFVGQDSNLVV